MLHITIQWKAKQPANSQNPRLDLYEVVRWAVPCRKSARAAVNKIAWVSTHASLTLQSVIEIKRIRGGSR